jgi:Ca2+-binding RTX toxin-like protein
LNDSIGNNDDALYVSVRPNGKIVVAGIDNQNNDNDVRQVAARLIGDNLKGAEQDVSEVEGFFTDDALFAQPPQAPIAPYLNRLNAAGRFYVLSQPRADGSAVIQLTDHFKDVSFSVVTDGDGNKVLAVNVDNLVLYYDPNTTKVLKIIGTDGNDKVMGSDSISVPMMIWGNAGNDILIGGGKDDQIRGGSGNDYVDGEEGNDAL